MSFETGPGLFSTSWRKQGTVTVSSGKVQLQLEGGSAQIAVPTDPRSVVGPLYQIIDAVECLLDLARMRGHRANRVIFESTADVTQLEKLVMIRIAEHDSKATVFISVDGTLHQLEGKIPHTETEKVGPTLFYRRGLTAAAPAQMIIERGRISMQVGGATASEKLPAHPRLLLVSVPAIYDTVIRLKRALKLPHGAVVDVDQATGNRLSDVERRSLKEAILVAQLREAHPWSPRTEPAEIIHNTLMYIASGSLIVGLYFCIVRPSEGPFAQNSELLGPICLAGFSVALVYWTAVQITRQRRRLLSLLKPAQTE